MNDEIKPPVRTDTLLLTAEQAWHFLGISRDCFFELKAAERLPPTVAVGRINMWHRDDIIAFAAKLRTNSGDKSPRRK